VESFEHVGVVSFNTCGTVAIINLCLVGGMAGDSTETVVGCVVSGWAEAKPCCLNMQMVMGLCPVASR
jgi:hypothetical protein